MSDTFKVGEIAIYVRPGSPYFGQEVEILGPLVFKSFPDSAGYHYWVSDDRPGKHYSKPEWLKKKKPPARDIDQKVSWNDCIWKPAGVVA